MSDFVLDASAGLALFLPAVKEQRDYADKVFSLIRSGAEPAVPSIWVVEMAAALLKSRRSRGISSAGYSAALDTIDVLPYVLHHIAYTVRDIADIAAKSQLAGYDSLYFDLARRLEIPMATLDDGIRSACQHHAVKLL